MNDKNFVTKSNRDLESYRDRCFFEIALVCLKNRESLGSNEDIITVHFGSDEIKNLYGNEISDFSYLRYLCENNDIFLTIREGIWHPNIYFSKEINKIKKR